MLFAKAISDLKLYNVGNVSEHPTLSLYPNWSCLVLSAKEEQMTLPQAIRMNFGNPFLGFVGKSLPLSPAKQQFEGLPSTVLLWAIR